jgi:competence protein ComEC
MPKVNLIGLLLFSLLTLTQAQPLKIYHIDVEQAASTLIVAPGNKTLLIDSGKNGHGSRIKSVMNTAGVNRIDFFVLTHYHEDHDGGIDGLANDPSITIGKAYDRGDKDELDATTLNEDTYKDYQASVGHNAEQLTRGQTIPLDPAMTVTCIASGGMVIDEVNPVAGTEENDKSIALLIQFGGFQFFTGGDIQVTTEGKIAAHDLVKDVDLYEADHHGSETSSTVPLMEDLKPTVIIISSGNNERYKHPRLHTLNTFSNMVPQPAVFQLNKYLKGGVGGNVPDANIADIGSTDPGGTILTTVDLAAGNFTIAYHDSSVAPFPLKHPGSSSTITSSIVIESLLPDPTVGPDSEFEEVTLHNKGTSSVSMNGWFLKDHNNLAWSLTSMGQIPAGGSKTIVRHGMPMNLNNAGDEITLFGPGNQERDKFKYTSSQPGQFILTHH